MPCNIRDKQYGRAVMGTLVNPHEDAELSKFKIQASSKKSIEKPWFSWKCYPCGHQSVTCIGVSGEDANASVTPLEQSKGSRNFLTQVPEVLGCILLAAISMQNFSNFLFVAIESLKHVGSKDNMSTIVEYWRRCAAATKAHIDACGITWPDMAQYGSVWHVMSCDVFLLCLSLLRVPGCCGCINFPKTSLPG